MESKLLYEEIMKIIIATTFRDFQGSINDEIQKNFLKSLEQQDNKKFKLVYTVFQEKNVEKEIDKYNFESLVCYSNLKLYRFSLSEVFLNAIKVAQKEDIILWTTSDVIYEINFFSNLIKQAQKYETGTCHPHKIYPSLKSFKNKENSKSNARSGFDLIFFRAKVLKNEEILGILKKYRNYDWGLFEHFLASLSILKDFKRCNLYFQNSIHKIENDRKPNKESKEWLKNSWLNNKKTLDSFLKDHNISDSVYNLMYCHYLFTFTLIDIYTFLLEYLGLTIFMIKKLLRNIVPEQIKNLRKKNV